MCGRLGISFSARVRYSAACENTRVIILVAWRSRLGGCLSRARTRARCLLSRGAVVFSRGREGLRRGEWRTTRRAAGPRFARLATDASLMTFSLTTTMPPLTTTTPRRRRAAASSPPQKTNGYKVGAVTNNWKLPSGDGEGDAAAARAQARWCFSDAPKDTLLVNIYDAGATPPLRARRRSGGAFRRARRRPRSDLYGCAGVRRHRFFFPDADAPRPSRCNGRRGSSATLTRSSSRASSARRSPRPRRTSRFGRREECVGGVGGSLVGGSSVGAVGTGWEGVRT